MDDFDWNSSIDHAIDIIKEQIKYTNNSCCKFHLVNIIKIFEKERIMGYEKIRSEE